MPGLVPGIHVQALAQTWQGEAHWSAWMAGTSPATTKNGPTIHLQPSSKGSRRGVDLEPFHRIFLDRAVGVVRGLTVYFYPSAAEASMYLLMILVLMFRPRGLFGERIQRFE